MKNELITVEEFAGWLRGKSDDEYVGTSCDDHRCILAQAIREVHPDAGLFGVSCESFTAPHRPRRVEVALQNGQEVRVTGVIAEIVRAFDDKFGWGQSVTKADLMKRVPQVRRLLTEGVRE